LEIWKRNLAVCWFGTFVTMIGMSQIAPVLPLYIKQLGVHDLASIERLSGIAFGATFIVSALFSPVWGLAADKFGRKPMLLRASLGMSVIIFSMGFAGTVPQLIVLRLLQGVITGYGTACITLIATQTPREQAGWALGTLATASIAGSLLGPLLGGYLEEITGLRSIFWITGALMMITFLTTLSWVKEDFTRPERKALSLKEVWRMIPNPGLVLTLFVTAFMLPLAMYSIEPIITVYITQLSRSAAHIALISGMTFAASGLASILAASPLGRLSDRIGPQKVMLAALLAAGMIFIPQAFVKTPWQLMGLRLLLGVAAAGLNPALNTLVKWVTPDTLTGRVFGLSMSAQYLGVFSGSVLGGQVAAVLGIQAVFYVTSSLLLLNGLWVYLTIFRKIPGRDCAAAESTGNGLSSWHH
jgi:DHA1 family multidrug resistance protein-like MFS transporter